MIIHNIKPSRSRNTLIDLPSFKRHHHAILRMALRNDIGEERFHQALNRDITGPAVAGDDNIHSSPLYRSIQFTGRHLIKYSNPFASKFMELRNMAKEIMQKEHSPLAEQIMSMDHTLISQNVRFFYPFEVQVVDKENQKNNVDGEANHSNYKKSQLKSAMHRLF